MRLNSALEKCRRDRNISAMIRLASSIAIAALLAHGTYLMWASFRPPLGAADGSTFAESTAVSGYFGVVLSGIVGLILFGAPRHPERSLLAGGLAAVGMAAATAGRSVQLALPAAILAVIGVLSIGIAWRARRTTAVQD